MCANTANDYASKAFARSKIWVPDVRAPEFVAEAHRQSAAVAASEGEADDQAFVDAISWDWATDEVAPPG